MLLWITVFTSEVLTIEETVSVSMPATVAKLRGRTAVLKPTSTYYIYLNLKLRSH